MKAGAEGLRGEGRVEVDRGTGGRVLGGGWHDEL